MSNEIAVKIGGRFYKLAVEPGQEHHVKAVAESFDGFVQKVQNMGAAIDRDRVLIMAGMMIADELSNLKHKRKTETETLNAFHNTLAGRLESLINNA